MVITDFMVLPSNRECNAEPDFGVIMIRVGLDRSENWSH